MIFIMVQEAMLFLATVLSYLLTNNLRVFLIPIVCNVLIVPIYLIMKDENYVKR